LQTADEFSVATPADWRPGDEVIVPMAGSCGDAKERIESKDENTKSYDWFFFTKKLDMDTVLKKILKNKALNDSNSS
jgi:peroxiredoxin 2/4